MRMAWKGWDGQARGLLLVHRTHVHWEATLTTMMTFLSLYLSSFTLAPWLWCNRAEGLAS